MTDYIILRDIRIHEDDNAWSEVGRAKASSARRALASLSLLEGEYVAVPARSWKPLTVTVETTTKITIG